MKRKNGGFTLIELLIAIAVLSTMAAVLLQAFVVSKRIDGKARKEEVVLDAAKRAMEEMKGYSFELLDRIVEENKAESGTVEIAGSAYRYTAVNGEENRTKNVEENGTERGTESGTERGTESGTENGMESGSGGIKRVAAGDDETDLYVKQGYILRKEAWRNPGNEAGDADYLVYVQADRGVYGTGEEEDGTNGTDKTGENTERSESGSPYHINRYQMPNIADVSSFQNAVVDPGILARDDMLLTEELLSRFEENEEEVDDESGMENGVDVTDTGFGSTDVPQYDESDVSKYLSISITDDGVEPAEGGSGSGTGGSGSGGSISGGSGGGGSGGFNEDGRLSVKVTAIYTVDNSGSGGAGGEGFNPELTLTAELKNIRKKVVADERTGMPLNRIYIFLPNEKNTASMLETGTDGTSKEIVKEASAGRAVVYEKIFVTADTNGLYELYVIMPDDGTAAVGSGSTAASREDLITLEDRSGEDSGIKLYTNIGDDQPVSLYQAKNRLYRLTVTVYEAVYEESGGADPTRGKELLKLESTKSE